MGAQPVLSVAPRSAACVDELPPSYDEVASQFATVAATAPAPRVPRVVMLERGPALAPLNLDLKVSQVTGGGCELLVVAVLPGSMAEGNLFPGDRITAVNGSQVRTAGARPSPPLHAAKTGRQ